MDVTSTATIPYDMELIVNPGANVKFSNGTSLVSFGKVTADGTSSNRINFTSAGSKTPGSWGTITLNGYGTMGSSIKYANIKYGTEVDILNAHNVSVRNCNIDTSSGHGLNFSYSTYCFAENNSIINYNTAHGILFQNGSNGTISNNVIKKPSLNHRGVGIYIGGGSFNTVTLNDIRGFDWGFCAGWGALASSYIGADGQRNNRITSCNTGVNVYNDSYLIFGESTGQDYYGGNSIYGNTRNTAVYNTANYLSTFYCLHTYFGPNLDTTLFYIGYQGTFTYRPYSTIDLWDGIPLLVQKKPNEVLAQVNALDIEDPNILTVQQPKYFSSSTSTSEIRDSVFLGIDLISSGRLKEAKNFFIDYITKHPDNYAAYNFLYHSADKETAPEVISFFNSLPEKVIQGHKLLLSYLYLKSGDIELSKSNNNKIIDEEKGTSNSAMAMMNNFYITLYKDNNIAQAESLLNEIKQQSELLNSIEIQTAEDALKVYGDSYISMLKKNITNNEKSFTYSLSQNYPNPFNPFTRINYEIPNDDRVTLKIYDIIGREVKVLENGYKQKGRYSVSFNASELASGVYLYQLKAGSYISTKKMILLK